MAQWVMPQLVIPTGCADGGAALQNQPLADVPTRQQLGAQGLGLLPLKWVLIWPIPSC